MSFINTYNEEFDPDKKNTFTHNLVDHPLFKIEELTKLALRHKTVKHHSANISKNQKLDTVLNDCPADLSIEEALTNIDTAGSFVFIMNVQDDPVYGELVSEIIKEIQPSVETKHKNLKKIQAWIFITSPNGVTPYHRDQETAHYFHIKGKKKFWLWNKNDKSVVTAQENEFFHGVHGLKETNYSDEKLKKGELFNVVPGNGIFFPYTAPHMVENGDEYSISFSVTHMSDEDYNEQKVYKINHLMRKLKLAPKDYQVSKLSDSLKVFIYKVLTKTYGKINKDWAA